MHLITDFIFDGVFRLYYCCFKIFLRGRLITADRKMHIILRLPQIHCLYPMVFIYFLTSLFFLIEYGFDWRGSNKSLHSLGLAVDINANENYMVDHGKVLAGSFWKPGKNPYSIKKNSDVKKYMKSRLKMSIK